MSKKKSVVTTWFNEDLDGFIHLVEFPGLIRLETAAESLNEKLLKVLDIFCEYLVRNMLKWNNFDSECFFYCVMDSFVKKEESEENLEITNIITEIKDNILIDIKLDKFHVNILDMSKSHI